MASQAKNTFEIPKWAGKPLAGLHLDVIKEGKMVQKLMIDEKKCYFFGRNRELCDFTIDHASCSRVHAALLWHKDLNRPFLIDLGSTHGTFIGHIRLESQKPQPVNVDSEIHFGESSRIYIIRERPQVHNSTKLFGGSANSNNENAGGDGHHNENDGRTGDTTFNMPDNEVELDNLTEFNTAHNRRIAQIAQIKDTIINLEDVDPNVGRFRNLVQTTVVLPKKRKVEQPGANQLGLDSIQKHAQAFHYTQLYDTSHPLHSAAETAAADASNALQAQHLSVAAKLGISIPNLAPDPKNYDVSEPAPTVMPRITSASVHAASGGGPSSASLEPRKKKYAKEAWPGKRPMLHI